MAVVAGLCLLTLAVAATDSYSRLDRANVTEAPLTFDEETVFTSLSDADTTAASMLLSGAVTPAALQHRFDQDILTAQAAATDGIARDPSGPASDSLAFITRSVPTYTGLVARAESENREGHPVASAYLSEASALLRTQLLAQADRAYTGTTGAIGDGLGAAGRPAAGLALAVGCVVLLLVASAVHRWLRTRFHRRWSVMLLTAFGLAAASLVVLVMASLTVASAVDQARTAGSEPLSRFTQARILALQVRADDELTVFTRGSDGSFQTDLARALTQLRGDVAASGDPVIKAGVDALATRHLDVQRLETQGRFDKAGAALSASGGAPGSPSAADLDAALAGRADQARASFTDRTNAAVAALLLGVVMIATLVTAAGVLGVQGVRVRLREYR